MGHENNRDLRNTGDGGWFYAENELFSVFAPLIGIEGVGIYMAMCRLIPLAAVDRHRPVTIRAVMEASCARRTMTNCKMAEIVALGMVLEEKSTVRNRPSTFTLVSLRQLAQVGTNELKRRLGVRGADTAAAGQAAARSKGAAEASSQSPASSVPPPIPALLAAKPAERIAVESAPVGVRPTDTEPTPAADTDSGDSVSGKQGVGVRKTGGRCPENGGSVSAQSGHPLTKKKEDKKKEDLKHTPLLHSVAPPEPERRVLNPPVDPSRIPRAKLIFASYPRQEGERSALHEITAAIGRLVAGGEGNPSLPPMAVNDAWVFLARITRRFAESPKGLGQFVPHPATWFRESRYTDDVEQWHRPQTNAAAAGGGSYGGSKGDRALAALAASLGTDGETGTHALGSPPAGADRDAGAGGLRAGADPVRGAGLRRGIAILPPPPRPG